MTRPSQNETKVFTDQALQAYLDGAASDADSAAIETALAQDDALGMRLMELDGAGAALRAAFDLDVLDAPAMPKPQAPPSGRAWGYVVAPVALAASFVLGMFVSPIQQAPASAGWIDQVANYQALYVTETLAGATQSSALTRSTFDRVEAELGLSWDSAPQIDGLTFKRAQMLGINGEALVQIAYLDADGNPWALCITRVGQDDRDLSSKMSHALAASSWVENGLGFVLVGGQDTDRAARLADGVRETI